MQVKRLLSQTKQSDVSLCYDNSLTNESGENHLSIHNKFSSTNVPGKRLCQHPGILMKHQTFVILTARDGRKELWARTFFCFITAPTLKMMYSLSGCKLLRLHIYFFHMHGQVLCLIVCLFFKKNNDNSDLRSTLPFFQVDTIVYPTKSN